MSNFSCPEPVSLLVVSSDRTLARQMQECFSLPEYHCASVNDGQAALKAFEHERFQLVLCEMRLPDLNGLELLQRSLALSPRAPFLMICSYRDWALAIEAMRTGAYDCLEKPFLKESWTRRVESALLRQQKEIEREMFHGLLEETLQDRTSHLHQALEQVEQGQRATLETLAMALDIREHMTHLHSLRVQAYTVLLAGRCGYAGPRMPGLAYGALLHDIGKIVVPDSILLKPGPLTAEEFRVMQQHPLHGYRILSRIPHLQEAALLSLCHHERMDGKGYPRGLHQEEIPVEARIFAVADALDAILSGRPYCPPRPMAEARSEMIRCAGSQFDQDVGDVFLQIAESEWFDIQEAVANRAPIPDPPLAALQSV